MTQYVVIVDPLSTGAEYGPAFTAAGVVPVAALTGSQELAGWRGSWHPENFPHIHQIVDDDVAGLAAVLRQYDPVCIVPGAESGVLLCDALIELLLPGSGNVPALSPARRDKWAMAQGVAAAGVPALRQIFTRDEADVEKWLADVGLLGADLVFKPPSSSGADDVHLVPAGQDWRPLLREMRDRVNNLGHRNDGALVQELAVGTEFLVDSYSVDGRHGLADVCRYTKFRHGDRIGLYDLVDFLPPEHPDVATVWAYTREVLDALGFRNGCGHAEVMVTAQGPRLIEIAARPAGGGHQMISRLATGSSQIDRTVAHRLRGEFTEGYELIQHVRGVFVSAHAAGVWRNGEVFDGVEKLPTFWAKNFPHATGAAVPLTENILTFLGWVILAGTDEAQVEADYREVKAREARVVID